MADPQGGSPDNADEELIVAVATAAGQSGVGIVRMSGAHSLALAARLAGKDLAPRHAHYVSLTHNAEKLDDAIALTFPGPNSFTGEDVVEFHCHGSPVLLNRLVRVLCELGARLARPGEFSERAFKNGKMDLAQAEAVADLIASGSEQAARAALRSLSGEFSARVNAIADKLQHMRVLLEASIDFPEEDEDFLRDYQIEAQVEALCQDVDALLVNAEQGRVLASGCTVALLGAPNAGKSSLLNRLSGEQTAIVTDIPGTTRDLLKIDLVVSGLPLRLVDTAGLRESDNPVEQEGMRRTRSQVGEADVVVLLLDLAADTAPDEQQRNVLQLAEVTPEDDRLLIVFNKVDLVDASRAPSQGAISVTSGAGWSEFTQALLHKAGLGEREPPFTARARHVDALQRCARHLKDGQRALVARDSTELVAEHLRFAHTCMGEIVGEVSADELLGRIFSEFCIGK